MEKDGVTVENGVFEVKTQVSGGGLRPERGDSYEKFCFAGPLTREMAGFLARSYSGSSAGAVSLAEGGQPDAGQVEQHSQDEADDGHGVPVYPTAAGAVKRDFSGAAFGNPFADPDAKRTPAGGIEIAPGVILYEGSHPKQNRAEIGADGRPLRRNLVAMEGDPERRIG